MLASYVTKIFHKRKESHQQFLLFSIENYVKKNRE